MRLHAPQQELLQGVVGLSRRRAPQIELLDAAAAADADVIMIDTSNAPAMAWAAQQTGLKHKTVIWVDGRSAPGGHTLLKRPVQWPILPMVLQRAPGRSQPPAQHSQARPAPPVLLDRVATPRPPKR